MAGTGCLSPPPAPGRNTLRRRSPCSRLCHGPRRERHCLSPRQENFAQTQGQASTHVRVAFLRPRPGSPGNSFTPGEAHVHGKPGPSLPTARLPGALGDIGGDSPALTPRPGMDAFHPGKCLLGFCLTPAHPLPPHAAKHTEFLPGAGPPDPGKGKSAGAPVRLPITAPQRRVGHAALKSEQSNRGRTCASPRRRGASRGSRH